MEGSVDVQFLDSYTNIFRYFTFTGVGGTGH